MASHTSNIYAFGEFRLLPAENILENGGNQVSLKPKAFSTLVYLVENHGRLVEKSEILERVWSGAFVEEASVSKCIWEIRAALSDDTKGSRFIQTVPKHGYRFVGDVTVEDVDEVSDSVALTGSFDDNVEAPPSDLTADADRSEPEAEGIDEPVPAELETQGPSKSRRFIYVAASLAIVVIAAGLLYSFFREPAQANAPKTISLAVLPLKPAVVEGRNQDLELALADSLILKISEAKGLNVKRLFAVRKFTDFDTDPVAAGKELEVDYVLASTYQIFNGRIRITSQLINVGTGISEETYRSETNADNIFVAQDIVSKDICDGLFAKFAATPDRSNAKRSTDNEKAYTLYNEAVFLMDKYNRADAVKAMGLLDQAVGMDPDYAAAWAAKAQAYCLFAHMGGGPPTDLFTRAEPNLEKALAIDGDNATALTIRGMINRDYYWNLPAAYRDLDRAIALDPNSTLAHRILAGAYYQDGRFAEALEEGKKAVDLNPTGRWDKWFLADYQTAAGHPEEGIAGLLHLAEIEPKFQPTYYSLWRQYYATGDTDKAFEYFIKNKQIWDAKPKEIEHFQKTYAKSGWKGVFRAELDLMLSYDKLNEYSTRKVYIAELAAQLGEADLAFQYLDEAAKFRVLQFSNVKVDPLLEPIRTDPRYAQLLTRSRV